MIATQHLLKYLTEKRKRANPRFFKISIKDDTLKFPTRQDYGEVDKVEMNILQQYGFKKI